MNEIFAFLQSKKKLTKTDYKNFALETRAKIKNLPVDVYYFTNLGASARRRVVAYSNVSYARGVCFAKLVNSHTPYCKNLGLKAKGAGDRVDRATETIDSASNPCSNHSCFVSVRQKLRFF